MTYTERKLKSIIRRVLRESTGLSKDMESLIINQYESSIKQLDGGFEIEIPNDQQTIEGAKELLQLRFGVDPEVYMEEEDGDFYILTYYGDPEDGMEDVEDFDPDME